MEEIIRISEMLSAVKWYFESKNLSLKNILNIKSPLSAESQKELRVYYSQYFAGLLSATELFLEKEYENNQDFKSLLEKRLIFDGFPNGEKNYSYLRELRNSIIHRGLDITTAANFRNNFPLFVSPSPIRNRSGKLEYNSFGFYIIEVVKKCENVIGSIFISHFEEFNLFDVKIPQDKMAEKIEQYINNLDSKIVPEWVKSEALKAFQTLELNHDEIHEEIISNLINVLNEDVFSLYKVEF